MYTLLNEGVIANVGCALIRRADLEKLTEKCSVMFSYELYRESSSNRINVLQWIVNDGRGFRLFRCFWPFVAGHAWRDAYARPQLVLLKRGDWNRQNCRTNSRVVQNQLAGWRSAHSGDCFLKISIAKWCVLLHSDTLLLWIIFLILDRREKVSVSASVSGSPSSKNVVELPTRSTRGDALRLQ